VRVALFAVALLAATALAGCGSSSGKDRDGDRLYDRQERDGWDVLVDALAERTRRHVASDPGRFDTDGDGLPDQEEFFLPTDPTAADTDGDGLTDCQENRHKDRAQCEDPDFSGPYDGGYGTDPRKQDSDPGASLYVLNVLNFTDRTGTLADGQPDSGDGIPDGEEIAGYDVALANGNVRFVRTDPRRGDTDGDHLDDGEERYQFHSDPTVADTDGDGCDDGVDPVPQVAEGYRPGLGSFTLKSGSATEVRLTLTLANVFLDVPASGGFAASQGQPVDLSSREPAPVRPSAEQCSYSARHPWILVQASASADGRSLDLASQAGGSGPGRVGSFYWNVQTGAYSWTDAGPALAAPIPFEGADARLTLTPTLAQGMQP
jgi:hypothetical protein